MDGSCRHMEYCPLISDPFIDDVLATTMSKKKDDINALFAFFPIFYEMLSGILSVYGKDIDDLLFQRFCEVNRNLYWAIVDLMCGAYYNSVQMMRLTFESIIQAYYLTLKYPGDYRRQLSEADKMERLKKPFSSIIVDLVKEFKEKMILSERDIRKIRRLYRLLSRKSHVSLETIRKIFYEKSDRRLFSYVYDEILFSDSKRLIEEVIDITFAIVLSTFLSRGNSEDDKK